VFPEVGHVDLGESVSGAGGIHTAGINGGILRHH